jgi:cyclopropane fatty-acyl-phospholipid synthase-like methyltransferase
MTQKPHAESCDENGAPIEAVLREWLPATGQLLEIGSGTGQHGVRFAAAFPGIRWQTSDRSENHPGIRMWLEEAGLNNLLPPLALDVLQDPWPEGPFEAVFSANTAHIMAMEGVEAMFGGVARVLVPGGLFLLYGPFMYDGEHVSESNQRFDQWLKSVEPHRGVRDLSWLRGLAAPLGLTLEADVEMPVNNRILVWRRESS